MDEGVVEDLTTRETPTNTDTTSPTIEEITEVIEGSSVDYTSNYDAINAQLGRLIELSEMNIETQNTLIEAMNYVLTYCVVIIPIVLIVMLLWVFFKQFLYTSL